MRRRAASGEPIERKKCPLIVEEEREKEIGLSLALDSCTQSSGRQFGRRCSAIFPLPTQNPFVVPITLIFSPIHRSFLLVSASRPSPVSLIAALVIVAALIPAAAAAATASLRLHLICQRQSHFKLMNGRDSEFVCAIGQIRWLAPEIGHDERANSGEKEPEPGARAKMALSDGNAQPARQA